MDAAFLIGSPAQPGLYTIRVHLKDGGLMPPHLHPDDRMITVLSGTLHYGFGETADPAATKAYPTGATFLAKANDPQLRHRPRRRHLPRIRHGPDRDKVGRPVSMLNQLSCFACASDDEV